MGDNGWDEHAKLVMHELERNNLCIKETGLEVEKLKMEIGKLQVEQAIQKTKIAGIIAAASLAGSIIGSIITIIVKEFIFK